MLLKETNIKKIPINKVLKENGDAMEYYMNHPEEHWDNLIDKFGGSRVKFENWCHKAYLGPRGPKGADQSKFDKAMAHFDSKQSTINESFQYEDILNMSYNDLLTKNGGNTMQTLRDLNAFMSSVQGTDNTEERKAYFKAKNFHVKLVKDVNEKDPKDLKKKIDKKIHKVEKRNR